MKRLRLATRGSALALAQSRSVAASLEAMHAGLSVELCILRSEGDQRAGPGEQVPTGGKGTAGCGHRLEVVSVRWELRGE